ncbi:thrombospondin type 3 repeat-containing protein [Hymenobacter sp. BT507]|uniref:Thrombospondin type 3 repeat-containing protein n=2 Tax=Hymenobacter citatus TaxID=2763506 RepID=A0ABR7MF09_9BACT|nr:thrombospondin type 3 repeat-containing protein [Hymenobacter citatus]
MDGRTWENATRNKYRLRLGLALTDIGAIRYNNAQYVRQARVANSQTLQLGQLDTIQIRNADDIAPTLDRLIGLSEQSQRFTTYLPTTLRLSADYRLLNHLYTGLQWTQSLLPDRTIGHRSISSLVLTPRLEFSRVEVAVPVLLTNRYRSLQLGAMVRLGPLLIGSDNLGGLLGQTAVTGADLYVGLGFALHKKRLKDRDKDGVSNKLDKCPKVKGTWALQGCPDQDGDGIADAADACPTEAGPNENKGCPLPPAPEQPAPASPAPTPEPAAPSQPEQSVAPTPPTTPTP